MPVPGRFTMNIIYGMHPLCSTASDEGANQQPQHHQASGGGDHTDEPAHAGGLILRMLPQDPFRHNPAHKAEQEA